MIWKFIWWFSEYFDVPLGRFAPFVLGKMIGSKGVSVEPPTDSIKSDVGLKDWFFCGPPPKGYKRPE